MMSSYDPFLKPIQPIGPEEEAKIQPALAEDLLIREESERGEIKVFLPEEIKIFAPYLAFILHFQENILTLTTSPTLPLKGGHPLRRFYNHLNELTKINQSKNSLYSATLTSLWNEVLLFAARNPSRELTSLIQEIQAYPQGAKYSLGYYLSEYAGKAWFPFPYIELLETLHQGSLDDPKKSPLLKWLLLLERLL